MTPLDVTRRESSPTIRTKHGFDLALPEIYRLRDEFLKQTHGVVFYSYQSEFSDALLRAVFLNTGEELFACYSRQSGKSEVLVRTMEFLFLAYHATTGRPIRIGIFAPQYEQAKTDFDRAKDSLAECAVKGFSTAVDEKESNATTLKLLNVRGEVIAICYAFPLTETSKVESKTLDLAIFEEAHQIQDKQREVKAIPMLASTNGASVSVGVGGFFINYFYRAVQAGRNVFFYDAPTVARIRREAYERDGNEQHRNYEKHLKSQQEKGTDRDAFKSQYLLQWVLGAGQFCVQTDLDAMLAQESYAKEIHPDGLLELHGENYSDQCETIVHYLERMETRYPGRTLYVGVDSAKHPDSTVVTVGVDAFVPTEPPVASQKRAGEEFETKTAPDTSRQVALPQNGKIAVITFDATGQGDFMPDWFERNTRWRIERVKFGPVSKDELYKRVQDVIANQRTKIQPRETSPEWEKFWQQFLDLQKEHSAVGLLKAHHPDDPNAHDDFPDSYALMEHSYWVWNDLYQQPQILVI